MRKHHSSKNISVKTESVPVATRIARHKFSLDGDSEMHLLTKYPFLERATKPDIISMEEIAAFENTDNPKDAIRKLVADAKKRRLALKIDDFEVLPKK